MTGAQEPLLVDPSRLWPLIVERYERALAAAAVHPLTTEVRMLEASGLHFVVRRLMPEAEAVTTGDDPSSRAEHSPFLPPYDPHLLVCRLSATHVCLLNKYPVFARHALLVTRRLEAQQDRLARDDFVAACIALRGVDGLVFYNSGPCAGASQSHRHLQLVPLPLGPGGGRMPIEPVLSSALAAGESLSCELPFLHRVVALDLDAESRAEAAADSVHDAYARGLESLELLHAPDGRRPAPYNLLLTRRWLYLVPRSRPALRSIEVNALGFAGAFLVGSSEALDTLTGVGPMQVLRQVGVTRRQSP